VGLKRLSLFLIVILNSVALQDFLIAGITGEDPPEELLLYDFENPGRSQDWVIVNDGVMGGLSRGEFVNLGTGSAVFKGTVSLENNGGFSSVRTRPRPLGLDGFHGVVLRVRGDGKKYQVRIRTDNRFDGVAHQCSFATEKGEWNLIKVPFSDCRPVFRGRFLNDVGPVSPEEIRQLGILVSDKQAGGFRLEIDWIKAYRD